MEKNRLEAFSDGVIAILITLMVFNIQAPKQPTIEALITLSPAFITYTLSFLYLAIYWNNHHHMFHLVSRISGNVLWGNLHLLFWLSLIPFATAWMASSHFSTLPTAFYGLVLLCSSLGWLLLQACIIHAQGEHSILKRAVGKDTKAKISALLYVLSISLAFVNTSIAVPMYFIVACMWLVPDKRFEGAFNQLH